MKPELIEILRMRWLRLRIYRYRDLFLWHIAFFVITSALKQNGSIEMNLESLPKYFSPKSMMPGAVPCGITSDTLTITDVMASLGLLTAKAAVGIELYLAKAGVLSSENIIAYIRQLAEQRAERHGALRKMERVSAQNFSTLWRVMYFAIIPSVRPAW